MESDDLTKILLYYTQNWEIYWEIYAGSTFRTYFNFPTMFPTLYKHRPGFYLYKIKHLKVGYSDCCKENTEH